LFRKSEFGHYQANELARHAQLIQHDKSIDARYYKALEILLEAEKAADQLVNDVNAAIIGLEAKAEELKKEAAAQRKARAQIEVQGPGLGLDKGKGKAPARDNSPSGDGQVSEYGEDGDLPRTPAGEEHLNKRRALQQRLRECYLVLHRIKFLQGDIYHVLGETEAAKEDAAYAVAEDLRHRLLRSECHDCPPVTTLTHPIISHGRVGN